MGRDSSSSLTCVMTVAKECVYSGCLLKTWCDSSWLVILPICMAAREQGFHVGLKIYVVRCGQAVHSGAMSTSFGYSICVTGNKDPGFRMATAIMLV
jgi:hypothetical protein